VRGERRFGRLLRSRQPHPDGRSEGDDAQRPRCSKVSAPRTQVRSDGSSRIPSVPNAREEMAGISWNYTTFLNIAFLLFAAALPCGSFEPAGWACLG
jgi:hypothetical protein